MKNSVLIVDDERVICMGLERLLESDYITYKAHNGCEAIEILSKQTAIDVMLCDIKMPGIDGCELIEKVRADNKDIFIIVISAATSPSQICDAMKKGANDFMRKPLDINTLETSIAKAVNAQMYFTGKLV